MARALGNRSSRRGFPYLGCMSSLAVTTYCHRRLKATVLTGRHAPQFGHALSRRHLPNPCFLSTLAGAMNLPSRLKLRCNPSACPLSLATLIPVIVSQICATCPYSWEHKSPIGLNVAPFTQSWPSSAPTPPCTASQTRAVLFYTCG